MCNLVLISKKTPLTSDKFDEFFTLLPNRGKGSSSLRSWFVSYQTIESNDHDLKAVNPNTAFKNDNLTKEELISLIEAQSVEFTEALASIKKFIE